MNTTKTISLIRIKYTAVIEVFKTYLKTKSQLSESEVDTIIAAGHIKKVRKRQYLLQEGDVWKYNCFVLKGCLRTYSVDEKGNEHIIHFALENWWAGDRASYESGGTSLYNIDALEDSEVFLIAKPVFEKLCKEIPALNDFVNALLHRSFIAVQNRIHTNISSSAEEKYKRFVEQYPQMLTRIPQGMIASYLGITKETLSRIRNQTSKDR